MDESRIPEDMAEVQERVAVMTERGFPVKVDDVIKESLKLGLQDIVDERMEGNYYTIRWDENYFGLQLFGIDNEVIGIVKPAEGKSDYVAQFKENAANVWFQLDTEVGKIIGR